MKDLSNPKLIHLKGILFLLIGFIATGLLIYLHPAFQTIVLHLVAIWAFCRAYYFAFYVIEKYVDGKFKFSGLGAFVAYLLKGKDKRNS